MKTEALEKFITRSQLQQRWGVSHMFIERKLENDPTFPQPYRFGDSKIARRFWKISEIEAWERAQVVAKRA